MAETRKRGKDRRPVLTAKVIAGLARLPELVPFSYASEAPEVGAALEYCRRLAAFESRPERDAERAAAAELTKRCRDAKRGHKPRAWKRRNA